MQKINEATTFMRKILLREKLMKYIKELITHLWVYVYVQNFAVDAHDSHILPPSSATIRTKCLSVHMKHQTPDYKPSRFQ